jgi:hypothetical protein
MSTVLISHAIMPRLQPKTGKFGGIFRIPC